MNSHQITKVQELIYTTRVEAVMAANVITVGPSMPMRDIKKLMRDERISGAPVMDEDRLVGIVTINDVIDAMENGKLDEPVSVCMTKEVRTVLKDAGIIEVIGLLGRQGYSKLPVTDREGTLTGILTTGTLIRGLLHQMDMSYKKKEAEKLYTYRASHIFTDIVSDDTSLTLRYIVDQRDFDNAGKASSAIKRSLQRLGVEPSLVRRIAVAVYEAEMNLVIHTDVGGEITVDIHRDRVKIAAVDHGPGIENIQQVLQPGYSTAPDWIRDMGFGAGMGLANIKRCSDMMTLLSEPGSGTRLNILFLFDEVASAGPRKKS